MKTPFEIKNGQKLCLLGTACGRCPYYNVGHGVLACMGCLTQDTLDYIQQLETEDVRKAQRIAGLEQELAAVKRERDAAIADMKKYTNCHACKHWDEDSKGGCQVKDDCLYGTIGKFEWRGVCPDNTGV